MEVRVVKTVISGRFEGVFSWLSLEGNMRKDKDNAEGKYHYTKVCPSASNYA